MKYRILVPRGLYRSLIWYLLWHWSTLGVKTGRWGPSSPTHIFHLSPSPSLEPSVRTLAGILRRPGSASSHTSGLPWINPGPWWYCGKWWQIWWGPLDFLSKTAVRRLSPSHCPSLLVGSWRPPSKRPTFTLASSRWLCWSCRILEAAGPDSSNILSVVVGS